MPSFQTSSDSSTWTAPGGLDKEELAVVLRSLGQKPSDEELEEMLATNVDGDPEGEKELDFSEFLKLMTAPDSRAARRLLVQIQEFRVSYTLLTGGGLKGSGDEGKEGPKEEGPKEERPVEADVEMIRAALVLLGDWCGNCGYSRVCDCGADPTQYTAEETPSTPTPTPTMTPNPNANPDFRKCLPRWTPTAAARLASWSSAS